MKIICILFVSLSITINCFSQTPEELSVKFVKQLEHQQYDSCYALFDTSMANKISVAMLEQMWLSIPRYMGEYKSYSSVTTEKRDSLNAVFVRCDFEKTKMDLQMVYNQKNKIVGMFFTPPKNKAAYLAPEYAQVHKFYESKLTLTSGKYLLPGALCVPNNTKNPPVIILVAGSGPNDKDETIGANKPLKDLALGLSSNGIATYRFDKRTLTYGKEIKGNISKLTIEDEVVEDVLNAVKMIKKNPLFKSSKIYIVGHSLGAMCSPLIASKSKLITGIVLLAGNARPLEDVLLEQYNYIFNLDSLDTNEKVEITKLTQQIQVVKNPQLLKKATDNELPLQLPSSYWQLLTKYNQLNVAKKIKQPILVIQGERDYQVTMKDFNLWKQNLNTDSKNSFISYPTLNHLLMSGEGKSTPTEYEKQGNVDEKIITDISTWIKAN
jgi:dienelactone hydrolase